MAVVAASALAAGEPSRQVVERARQVLEIAGIQGGLVVHLGCGGPPAGELTAALRANERYLVQGLDRDTQQIDAARRHIQSLGTYGPVSVAPWSGTTLPYVDNLVNLLVVSGPSTIERDEILRVLAPAGVAIFTTDDGQLAQDVSKLVKPRPAAMDDWPHALYDAGNNCVSRDAVVGPPQHLQWVAEPRNARHHETLASVSVAVSAAGRLFAILDEAPATSIQLPAQWRLVARDAFNGVLLWKQPIETWQSHLWGAQNGPPELSRRLVASGDRVYATLGLAAPVSALNAATGQIEMTYAGTAGTEEILELDGELYLVVGPATGEPHARGPLSQIKTVMAVEAATGRALWKRADVQPLPMSLAAQGERLFWLTSDALVSADARTGAEVWRTERQVARQRPVWSAPTLVAHGDVVLCADRRPTPEPDIDESTGKKMPRWLAEGGSGGELVAYSAQTGQKLWSTLCGEAYHTPVDVFVQDELVWVGRSRARQGPDFTQGLDLLTGEVRRQLSPDRAYATTMPHHRCYRNRVAGRYIVAGRTGVEFIDLQTGEAFRHHWVRGTCQFGVVPANGLLYSPPHSCACYIEAKLTGMLALAPQRRRGEVEKWKSQKVEKPEGPEDEKSAAGGGEAGRIERGPAYSEIRNPKSEIQNEEDWPTYRHDAARSGRSPTSVPAELKINWQTPLGGRLTPPVIADGRVLVASVDKHTLYALDAGDGRLLWQFTAGGRIDSPPTLARGLAVFGSADGWLYCLRAADGVLAWRHRVAPQEQHCTAFGQLESVWPAHGSVLVRDDKVCCTAGRSSFLDGGIWLYQLDLANGSKRAERQISSRDPQTGEQPGEPIIFEMPGALPDILSTDGDLIYMRHLGFAADNLQPRKAPPHLYSPAGFLNDDWWHRTYWIFGDHFYSGYIGWYFAGRETPAGRLLVLDDGAIYGFGYRPEFYHTANKQRYHLYAIDRSAVSPQPAPDYARANRDYPASGGGKFSVAYRWSVEVPLLVRAQILAGDKLFLAGPPSDALESQAAFDGAQGASLYAVSAADGKTLAEYPLDALPIFDGLAAAQGRLYLTLQDGRLVCF